MKNLKAMVLLMLACGIVAGAQSDSSKASNSAAQTPASGFKDDQEKLNYALGMRMALELKNLRKTVNLNPEMIAEGLKDSLSGGKTRLTDDERITILTQLQRDLRAKEEEVKQQMAETNLKEGEAFLAANKSKEGVVALPSGLQYKILKQGTGPKPTLNDSVVCNYSGTLINGKEFDSSYKRGLPSTFPVVGVIRGWIEALQLMPVGSKWQIFVPPSLAYGERGHGSDIEPNSTLIFEVELLSIKPKENATEKKP